MYYCRKFFARTREHSLEFPRHYQLRAPLFFSCCVGFSVFAGLVAHTDEFEAYSKLTAKVEQFTLDYPEFTADQLTPPPDGSPISKKHPFTKEELEDLRRFANHLVLFQLNYHRLFKDEDEFGNFNEAIPLLTDKHRSHEAPALISHFTVTELALAISAYFDELSNEPATMLIERFAVHTASISTNSDRSKWYFFDQLECLEAPTLDELLDEIDFSTFIGGNSADTALPYRLKPFYVLPVAPTLKKNASIADISSHEKALSIHNQRVQALAFSHEQTQDCQVLATKLKAYRRVIPDAQGITMAAEHDNQYYLDEYLAAQETPIHPRQPIIRLSMTQKTDELDKIDRANQQLGAPPFSEWYNHHVTTEIASEILRHAVIANGLSSIIYFEQQGYQFNPTDKRTDSDGDTYYVCYDSVKSGELDMTKMLLSHADWQMPSKQEALNVSLILACRYGQFQTALWLVRQGADPKARWFHDSSKYNCDVVQKEPGFHTLLLQQYELKIKEESADLSAPVSTPKPKKCASKKAKCLIL